MVDLKEKKIEDFDREDRQGVMVGKEPIKVDQAIQIEMLNYLVEILKTLKQIEANTRPLI